MSVKWGEYQVIYADMPWAYNDRRNKHTRFCGGAMAHYPVMKIPEIKNLPVAELAADNAALFMWCTFPQLDEQIKLFSHWGFKYVTVAFNWVKTNKKNNNPFFGIGYYTKSNSEVCLLGIRGKMKPVSNSVSSIIIAPRREHSRKPDEARERIVQLFGDVPRVELFARQQVAGWDQYGNDLDGRDIRDVLKKAA
jgi:N6-adenosine-specific RNA methylase IME4